MNRRIGVGGNRVLVINLIWIPSAAQGRSWQKDNLKNTYESVMCKTYTIYKMYKSVYSWKCCSNDSSISKFGLFYFIDVVVYNVLYFRMKLPYPEASINVDFLAGVEIRGPTTFMKHQNNSQKRLEFYYLSKLGISIKRRSHSTFRKRSFWEVQHLHLRTLSEIFGLHSSLFGIWGMSCVTAVVSKCIENRASRDHNPD